MFINTISYYLPTKKFKNNDFLAINGLNHDWIVSRTGIEERRHASPTENTSTMAIDAVKNAIPDLPFPIEDIDLIVGASYTPHDTIVTLAHAVQNAFDIPDIPVVAVSSACSSLLNALEVAEGYFAMGKASKALVVAADHNTAYANLEDKKTGHLWGDGAVAFFLSKDKISDSDLTVKSIITGGAGTKGKAMEGVMLRPLHEGYIHMPNGRDVFIHACQYMPDITKKILRQNNYTLADLDYLIPHQANLRITKNVANTLNSENIKAISNIQKLGNTGSAGCGIALAQTRDQLKKEELVVMTVFGGGYSYGAMLLEA